MESSRVRRTRLMRRKTGNVRLRSARLNESTQGGMAASQFRRWVSGAVREVAEHWAKGKPTPDYAAEWLDAHADIWDALVEGDKAEAQRIARTLRGGTVNMRGALNNQARMMRMDINAGRTFPTGEELIGDYIDEQFEVAKERIEAEREKRRAEAETVRQIGEIIGEKPPLSRIPRSNRNTEFVVFMQPVDKKLTDPDITPEEIERVIDWIDRHKKSDFKLFIDENSKKLFTVRSSPVTGRKKVWQT